MKRFRSFEPKFIFIVNSANFLLLNVINHLPQLLIGAALAGQVGLRPAAEHIPSLVCHFLNRFNAGVNGEHLHLLVHFALRTTILDLLLVLLLIDGGVRTLQVSLVEGYVVLHGPVFQTAELFLQAEVDLRRGHTTIPTDNRYSGNRKPLTDHRLRIREKEL